MSFCCCCLSCWMLHRASQSDHFSSSSLCWCSPQNFLTLARYGNFWVDSIHVSSSVSYYSSPYLFFNIFTLFHLLSIPLSYFRFGYLLSFVYTPCLAPCLSCGVFSCALWFWLSFHISEQDLHSLEAPSVPIRSPLRTSTVVPAGCQPFVFWLKSPPMTDLVSISICGHSASPENNPSIP